MSGYDERLDPTGEGADRMYHEQRDREHERAMSESMDQCSGFPECICRRCFNRRQADTIAEMLEAGPS